MRAVPMALPLMPKYEVMPDDEMLTTVGFDNVHTAWLVTKFVAPAALSCRVSADEAPSPILIGPKYGTKSSRG